MRRTPTGASRHYLMCPPDHFDVAYVINPWMSLDRPVDHARAMAQWETLRETYELLGHKVDVIDPVAGLPDMVFAANAGTVLDGRVVPARFRYEQRRGEEAPFKRWFDDHGFEVVDGSIPVNEGEGDFLVVGDTVLAGTGFRSDAQAAAFVQEALGCAVVQLQLVDPRFYHLDTALGVLDESTIAYFPEAFTPGSQRALARLFPDAVVATEADAAAFGLNLVSDGRNVVLPAGAAHLAQRLKRRGYEPSLVAMDEFIKAGGAVKCCTLELREAR